MWKLRCWSFKYKLKISFRYAVHFNSWFLTRSVGGGWVAVSLACDFLDRLGVGNIAGFSGQTRRDLVGQEEQKGKAGACLRSASVFWIAKLHLVLFISLEQLSGQLAILSVRPGVLPSWGWCPPADLHLPSAVVAPAQTCHGWVEVLLLPSWGSRSGSALCTSLLAAWLFSVSLACRKAVGHSWLHSHLPKRFFPTDVLLQMCSALPWQRCTCTISLSGLIWPDRIVGLMKTGTFLNAIVLLSAIWCLQFSTFWFTEPWHRLVLWEEGSQR